jgi:hypothetical protein
MMASELVGRDSEIAAVESLLAGIAGGGGSLLVLGDPGIGKSALAGFAARRAADAGMRMLGCAGVLSEAQFSFAGLHHLLRPVLAEADGLPRGQRDALLVSGAGRLCRVGSAAAGTSCRSTACSRARSSCPGSSPSSPASMSREARWNVTGVLSRGEYGWCIWRPAHLLRLNPLCPGKKSGQM